MAYIYLITCQVNGKKYVGKTNHTVEKRWKEHCSDYTKEHCEKRPLYRAMKKYGVHNFTVETLEKCSAVESSDKEIFWINKLDTYRHGYNATIGGDGSRYVDYDKIVELYQNLGQVNLVAEKVNCSRDTVIVALQDAGVKIRTSYEVIRDKKKKFTEVFDAKTGELIQTFETITDTAKWLISQKYATSHSVSAIAQKITEVNNGKRKSAYGFTYKVTDQRTN
jgi:group I intron endonuclease